MKPLNHNLHALSPASTPLGIVDIVPDNTINFCLAGGKEVLKISKDENNNTVCEWGEGITHYMNLNLLEEYLKDLVSPGMREALVREIKIKMSKQITNIADELFTFNL